MATCFRRCALVLSYNIVITWTDPAPNALLFAFQCWKTNRTTEPQHSSAYRYPPQIYVISCTYNMELHCKIRQWYLTPDLFIVWQPKPNKANYIPETGIGYPAFTTKSLLKSKAIIIYNKDSPRTTRKIPWGEPWWHSHDNLSNVIAGESILLSVKVWQRLPYTYGLHNLLTIIH